MRIAIIGSGLSGLTAAYRLGQHHHISLYERHPRLGMAAHGLSFGGARVDIPLRVIYPAYYPSLLALYADAGIATTPTDYSACFCDVEGHSYFRYQNWRPLPQISLPLVPASDLLSKPGRHIATDLGRLLLTHHRASQLPSADVALQDYLTERGYGSGFCEQFLYPSFAAIHTCDLQHIRQAPAREVIDYLRRGILHSPVHRTVCGADSVVQTLSQSVRSLHLNARVAEVEATAEGVQLRHEDGKAEGFDHVILATPAPVSAALLAKRHSAERQLLEQFEYVNSRVVVHKDPTLMPQKSRDWSSVNFRADRQGQRPMATIWLNRVLPVQAEADNVFQSWNPLCEPRRIEAEAEFPRPLINTRSNKAIASLQAAMQQSPSKRRLWFCGSYAARGVPLLESACASAEAIARQLLSPQ